MVGGIDANPMAAQQAQQTTNRIPQAGPVERPQVQGPPPQALAQLGTGNAPNTGFQLNLPQPVVNIPEPTPGVEAVIDSSPALNTDQQQLGPQQVPQEALPDEGELEAALGGALGGNIDTTA